MNKRLLTVLTRKGLLSIGVVLVYFNCQACTPRNGWRVIKEKEIVGTWRLVSYNEPNDSVFHHLKNGDEAVKLNTGKNYSFAYFNKFEGRFTMAGGGTYRFTNGLYTERMEYFSLRPSILMQSFSFTLMIKGDSLFQKSTTANGLEEYWLRQK